MTPALAPDLTLTVHMQVVVVAFLRRFVFRSCNNDSANVESDCKRESLERYFTSVCIGLAAVLHM